LENSTTLGAGEILDDGQGFSDGFLVELDDAGAALELIRADAGEQAAWQAVKVLDGIASFSG
jgi:hypothetical protein